MVAILGRGDKVQVRSKSRSLKPAVLMICDARAADVQDQGILNRLA